VNSSSTNCDSLKLKNKVKKKSGFTTSSSAANLSSLSVGPPPIPEPDYSLSESEGDVESEGEGGGRRRSQAVPQSVVVAATEMSENSNASGSSSSSGTLPHSFSVEEIQKVRTQLKSSKSYPNDFLLQNANTGEDGDNSSSGVSSDQDVPVGPPTGFDDGRSSEGSGGSAPDEKGVKGPNFQKQTSVTVTVPSGRQRTALSGGVLTRNAVSLAQLPPPLEREGEAEGELVVPPPPEFLGASSNGSGGPEEVLAPPPQFCDNRLVTRVRIVGAVPKTPGEDSQLHSH
jgi:SH3/ankyrin repeat-containing protein